MTETRQPTRREALLREIEQAEQETRIAAGEWGIGPASPRYQALMRWAITLRDAADLLCEEGDGWQPIDTAPKDGTVVLLYGPKSPGWQPSIVDGSWNRGGAFYQPHWMGGIFNPTHWMPLPQAPGSRVDVREEGDQ